MSCSADGTMLNREVLRLLSCALRYVNGNGLLGKSPAQRSHQPLNI